MAGYRIIAGIAACAGWLATVAGAPAQTETAPPAPWPSRPLTLVVPYAAGGPVDTVARIMAARMSELLEQQVVIENVSGAGGMIGSQRVAQAAPDGYTMLYGGSAVLAQNQAIYKKPLVDGAKDFTFVAMFADQPRVLVTRKNLPVDDLKSFLAYMKANESRATFGSAGAGSGSHVCPLIIDKLNGTKITHVPYRGSAPALQDLVAGRLDFMAEQISTVGAQVEAGNLRALAILGRDRASSLPNVPAAAEQGLDTLDCGSWQAILLPKGAPDAIVQRLAKAVDDAVETPAVRERFTKIGVTIPAKERRTPAYLAAYTASEIKRWGAVIREAGVAAD